MTETYRTYAKMCFDTALNKFIYDLATKTSEETYAISYETVKVFEEYFNKSLKDLSVVDISMLNIGNSQTIDEQGSL